jgi:hypothetical protein
MKHIIKLLFLSAILISSSCTKNPSKIVAPNAQEEISETTVSNLKKMLDELPTIIRVRDEKNNRFVDFDIKNKSISILKSWSFANPTPNTVYSTTSGFVIYISDPNPAWGMGSGSQTITAGSTTLQVQTMCLAMAGFSNLFSSGQSFPIDGISLVMGLDADFSMLNNANTMCFSDFIHGVAFYEVFESPASGSYDVIDWTDPNFDFTTYFTSQNGYAFVFSFDNCNQGNFYFSKEGQITVNGGDMTFSGEYWGWEDWMTAITQGVTINAYPGSGTMGCN